MHGAVHKAFIELGGGYLDSVLELLLSENDVDRHDGNAEGVREIVGKIRGAVGYNFDRHDVFLLLFAPRYSMETINS